MSIFLPPAQTRLVTIAAHVDHGKTSLADSLIEHNGIISERLAGTLRYLDSDPEEQRRGITMRSSAIGLSHQYQAPPGKKSNNTSGPRIVHLVDSPGHTDFSYEVSSALAACDTCLLVVDAVEGMGPRTHQVFREALAHQLVPILVVNKMDRLCTDLCLTPTEAYLRTRSLLESVNAAASAMITSSAHHVVSDSNHDKNANNNSNSNNHHNNQGNTQQQQEEEEQLWTFDPAKGNVVFCSALFGWGFTSASLARSLFRSQIIPNIKPILLRQHMFGDFKYKNSKVLKWNASSKADEPPMFAEYGLQPIWDIYQGVSAAAVALGQASSLFADRRGTHAMHVASSSSSTNHPLNNISSAKIKSDTPGMDQVLEALQLGATGEEATAIKTVQDLAAVLTRTGANTEESILRSVLRRFRPLAPTVLDVVCDYGPSPQEAASSVRSRLLSLQTPQVNNDTTINTANTIQPEAFQRLASAVRACDASPDTPTCAHVCKFFSSDRLHIRDSNLPPAKESDGKNVLLGLTRVLSGRLKTGSEYYLLGPKYNEKSPEPPKKPIRLYLLMGSSFVMVNEVPAGHLCAVLGLEDVQLKTVTLCDQMQGAMPLSTIENRVRPLVKVNVEAEHSEDAQELDRGLLKLSLADAAVEVTATARGERILACLGELHLEQSILDLKKVYCSREIALRTSDPICDFGESTDWFPNELSLDYKAFWDDPSPQPRQATIPPFNEEEGLSGANHGRSRTLASGRSAALSLRVVPLKESVFSVLQQKMLDQTSECEEEIVKLGKALGLDVANKDAQAIFDALLECVCTLGVNGTALMESPALRNGFTISGVGSENGEVYVPPQEEQIVDEENEAENQNLGAGQNAQAKEAYDMLQSSIRNAAAYEKCREQSKIDEAATDLWKRMKGSAIAGFQMAIRSGPICEEPVRNILVVLEGFEIAMSPSTPGESPSIPAKPLASGMVLSALRSGIRCALLTRPVRLVEGYLRLTLNSSLAGIGSLYSVLSKRRGKIEEDSMVDGTDLLAITAIIPQAEAFGLAPELFAKTSGEVTAPEMIFSHWQQLDVDPFWIPTTEEEREDYGELLVAGDSSTGMDNTALKYIRNVRTRKGLKVDSSRTVVAAEKQRTLKR